VSADHLALRVIILGLPGFPNVQEELKLTQSMCAPDSKNWVAIST
jgi:hypothetical protein